MLSYIKEKLEEKSQKMLKTEKGKKLKEMKLIKSKNIKEYIISVIIQK